MLELNVMRMEGRPPTIHSVWDSFWRVTLVLFFYIKYVGFPGVSCISETLVYLISQQ